MVQFKKGASFAMISRKWIRHLVPEELPAGPVRLIVLLPDEDDAGSVWANGIARKWSAELSGLRQDIYTLDGGQPVNAPR